jgi:hypothetical protein
VSGEKEVTPDSLIVVLAFTGVPTKRLNDRPCNGRWDEVFRSLLALKQLQSSVDAIVLLEVAEDRTHLGVAALVVSRKMLNCVVATCEQEFIALFGSWTQSLIPLEDACCALQFGLQCLFPDNTFFGDDVLLSCFASPDDDIAQKLKGRFVASPERLKTQKRLVVKVFGGPCHWAQSIEVERVPRLVVLLEKFFQTRCNLVHLGKTRLRASQCVLCADGVKPYEDTSTRIPRIAFHLSIAPTNLQKVVEMVHHFLVETMWTERRRDMPRHYLFVMWQDEMSGCLLEASISSRQIEHVRGDAKLREKRLLELHIKER